VARSGALYRLSDLLRNPAGGTLDTRSSDFVRLGSWLALAWARRSLRSRLALGGLDAHVVGLRPPPFAARAGVSSTLASLAARVGVGRRGGRPLHGPRGVKRPSSRSAEGGGFFRHLAARGRGRPFPTLRVGEGSRERGVIRSINPRNGALPLAVADAGKGDGARMGGRGFPDRGIEGEGGDPIDQSPERCPTPGGS
jgi:hypothetical protein